MSGLEPVVALSLACNVLQVIGVARDTIHTVRQVYQHGELDPTLTDHATRLDDLSKRIRPAMMPTTTAQTTTLGAAPGATQRSAAQPRPTDRDTQLLGLANRCLNAARDLREEVNFLKGPDTKSKLVTMLKSAVKTAWRHRRLDRLGKDMLDAEQLVAPGLLTKIFEQTEKATGGLDNLDSDLRLFVEEYRAGRSETAELVRTEAAQTRKHVAIQIKQSTHALKKSTIQETTRAEASLKKHITQVTGHAQRLLGNHISTAMRSRDKSRDTRERDIQLEVRGERLLRSLKFNRMNERRNMVAKSHPKTYEWVLRDGSDAGEPAEADANHPWDSFSDWLRSTEPVYWISGKPGSGKTTLVNYLLGHSQTRAFLEQWSPGVIIVSHFFWRPGTQMQQSIRGLFCSLLHQLLEGDKALVNRILPNNINALDKDVETDWSYDELQSTLLDVMVHYPRSMALFLDGLDEVLPADGTLALLDVVNALQQSQGLQGKVKLCLGARREPLIQQKLWACPHLRLEHLNYPDLRRYARDTISIPSRYQICVPPGWRLSMHDANGHLVNFSFETPPTPPEIRHWLITELVRKTEGVFLWLCLTTKTVMEALWQGHMFTDLQDRIDSLPSDLTKLYADMWARANGDSEHPEHQERAALYFQLAIKKWFDDPLSLTIATTTDMASQILNCNSYKAGFATSVVELCTAKMRDIEIRSAGLLQVNPIPEESHISGMMPWYGKEYYDLIPYAREETDPALLEFVHRTASDFLADTVEGLMILRKHKISEWYLRQRFVAARLARCRLLRVALSVEWPDHYHFYTRPLYEDYNSLWRHLESITLLLHALPEGEEENARGECDKLFRFCEQLYESGQLFRDHRLLRHHENYQEEGEESDSLPTVYEVIVKREHEFLLEAASMSLNIWPLIRAKVQNLELDKQTLSELLLHVCNIEFAHYEDALWFQDGWDWEKPDSKCYSYRLGIDSRLSLARLLLEQGACPSCKGPRRIGNQTHFATHLVYVLETPLKGLISSVWRLDRDTNLVDSNVARHFINFIRLLKLNGADADGEEFRVTYQVQDGHLFERPLHFGDSDGEETSVQGIEGMRFVLTYPLTVILARMLQGWKDRFPEIDPFPEARDIIQDAAMLGRLILILHSKSTRSRMCFVEAEQELEGELMWVAREAEQILQAQNRKSFGVLIPLEIQQGLSRALERRDPEGAEQSQTSQRLFKVFQRAGMTSIYWGEWEDGCFIMNSSMLGN